jgi:hypothetical protein
MTKTKSKPKTYTAEFKESAVKLAIGVQATCGSQTAKELADVLASPYHSGWMHFILGGKIQTDIGCAFIIDKPHPASILKIYAKAKILPNYKGLA